MNTNLPITSKRGDIIRLINKYDTVVLTAETGSGKSTQVPQYLYEEGYNVIVTQPRRLACISLANRVAEEMGCESNVVAYQTAFESTKTKDTRILFCTDGLQMAKGIKVEDNTVLVIDEVHEWNLNIETLIAWVKYYDENHDTGIKTILMSATMQAYRLCTYFYNAALIEIPGRRYDVSIKCDCAASYEQHIIDAVKDGKDVLAFKEGKKEIYDLIEDLKSNKLNAEILPLHGELSYQEQNKCFAKYDRPKVIVATNIAQTSITLDVDVVVDNGYEKRVEAIDNIEGLYTRSISKADCLQRAGRAGRTKDGEYYLCSTFSDLNSRPEEPMPEIQRMTLDKVVLKLASVGIDARTLDFFHKPNSEALQTSYKYLNLIGALEDISITDIGKRILRLPVSVRFGRMLIEAEKYKCASLITKAVALLEVGSLVNFKYQINDYYTADYDLFTQITSSDILANIDIYTQYSNNKIDAKYAKAIIKKNYFRAKEIIDKITEVMSSEFDFDDKIYNYKHVLIRCIAAAMPDYFYRSDWGSDYVDASNEYYKLDSNSCIMHDKYAFAIPKTITYTDRWNVRRSMNIISMVTSLSFSDVNLLLGDKIEWCEEPHDVDYDSYNDVFIAIYKASLYGVDLEPPAKYIYSDNPKYPYFVEHYKHLMEKKDLNNKVIIGDHAYKFESDYRGKCTIYLDAKDIFKTDIKTLTKDNKPVRFCTSLASGTNLDTIRQSYIKKYRQYTIENIMCDIPKDKTGSIKIIIDKFLPLCGERSANIEFTNDAVTIYIGLYIDGSGLALKAFSEYSLYKDTTIEALQFIANKYVNNNYSDRNFIVKRNGKKIETKKTIEAKESFHEFYRDCINGITVDNFADQIALIDELFADCIATFDEG